MNKIKRFFRDWSIFKKVWLVSVCSLMTVIWFINGDTSFMLVLSPTGSLNLALGTKGKVAGFYFVTINSALYAYQCLGILLYGGAMYNVPYGTPVSVVVIYLWNRNATSDDEVRFRTMTPKFMAGAAVATAVGAWGYLELLKYMGGSFVFMDSLTTMIFVTASMLYPLRYSEQWFMWVIVNALSTIMRIMVLVSGDTTALLIIVTKTVDLLNSLYGYVNWRKVSQKTAKQPPFSLNKLKECLSQYIMIKTEKVRTEVIMEEKLAKYEQIRQDIIHKIESMEYRPNQAVPSEDELCASYGVSRVTVRKVIDGLVHEGLLYRIRGKGSSVGDHVSGGLSRTYSFTEAIPHQGKTPSKRLLSLKAEEADADIRRRMGLKEREEVYVIKSTYYADGRFHCINASTLPKKLFPKLELFDFNRNSLYKVLKSSYQLSLTKARQVLNAMVGSSEIYGYLETEENQPLLRINATSLCLYHDNEMVFETYESYILTDILSYYVEKHNTREER